MRRDTVIRQALIKCCDTRGAQPFIFATTFGNSGLNSLRRRLLLGAVPFKLIRLIPGQTKARREA